MKRIFFLAVALFCVNNIAHGAAASLPKVIHLLSERKGDEASGTWFLKVNGVEPHLYRISFDRRKGKVVNANRVAVKMFVPKEDGNHYCCMVSGHMFSSLASDEIKKCCGSYLQDIYGMNIKDVKVRYISADPDSSGKFRLLSK